MIYRLDHLALSCADLNSALTDLRQFGYEPRFVEKKLPNRSEKRPFLRNYKPTHDIAYCESAGELPIELTCHRTPLGEVARSYVPIISSIDCESIDATGRNTSWAVTVSRWQEERDVECGMWRPLAAPVCRLSGDATGESRDEFIVAKGVPNVVRSAEFWTEALGFVREEADTDGGGMRETDRVANLLFTSPLQERILRLILYRSAGRRAGHLDDAGFPCLAFLTTSLMADRERAVRCGATKASEPFCLEVAGHDLTVSVVEGPSGELVELVHMER